MKIIDLLNKIANGEEVKAFKFDNYIFKYDMDRENWKNENDDILSTYCNVEECLNDEVEILEEKKKIPEKLDKYADISGDLACEWTFGEKKLKDKINEIIDCLDYLKSKGDE